MRQPIVVGTDLSEASDDALMQADARARHDSVPLTVVHVVKPAHWGSAPERGELGTARRAVRDRVVQLTGRPERFFEVLVVRGIADSELARVAKARAAMLFIGRHLERRVGHAFLRDVPERLAARARPVFVAKPSNGSKRVLVALASPLDDGATLDAGVDEARESESELVVVHSVHMGFLEAVAKDLVNGGAYAAHPLGEHSQVVRARTQIGSELMRRGMAAEVHVVDGAPESAIVDVAQRTGVDLIVVGTAHGSAPLSRVAAAVLRRAPCSVLVVDSSTPRRENAFAQHAAV